MFGSIFTYSNLKQIVLHTKRRVLTNGSTVPFLNFKEFSQFYDKCVKRDDNEQCEYYTLPKEEVENFPIFTCEEKQE